MSMRSILRIELRNQFEFQHQDQRFGPLDDWAWILDTDCLVRQAMLAEQLCVNAMVVQGFDLGEIRAQFAGMALPTDVVQITEAVSRLNAWAMFPGAVLGGPRRAMSVLMGDRALVDMEGDFERDMGLLRRLLMLFPDSIPVIEANKARYFTCNVIGWLLWDLEREASSLAISCEGRDFSIRVAFGNSSRTYRTTTDNMGYALGLARCWLHPEGGVE